MQLEKEKILSIRFVIFCGVVFIAIYTPLFMIAFNRLAWRKVEEHQNVINQIVQDDLAYFAFEPKTKKRALLFKKNDEKIYIILP